jgi:hypothetical protein
MVSLDKANTMIIKIRTAEIVGKKNTGHPHFLYAKRSGVIDVCDKYVFAFVNL